MEILKQIAAKEKAIDVINSCETIAHIMSARRYIKLYENLFEDMLGAMSLNDTLDLRSREISRIINQTK